MKSVQRIWANIRRTGRPGRLPLHLICSLLLGVFLSLNMASAADSFTASVADGYGRMIFTPDPGGPIAARMTGSVLVISFPHAVSFKEGDLIRRLGGYIASGRKDADGKTFRFALAQLFRLQVSTDGTRTAVDLIPSSYNGTPPKLEPRPGKPPLPDVDMNNLANLPVRVGRYQNFTRLVFDWPKRVDYKVTIHNGQMQVRFEGAAKPDFTALKRIAPPWVKAEGWKIDDRRLVATFRVDTDSGYHAFHDGNHIVVDVLSPSADAASYKPPGTNHPQVTMGKGGAKTAAGPGLSDRLRKKVLETATEVNTPALEATLNRPPDPQVAGKVIVTGEKSGSKDQAYLVRLDNLGKDAKIAAFARGAVAWVVVEDSPALDISQLEKSLSPMIKKADALAAASVNILRLVLNEPEEMSARMRGERLEVRLSPREKVKSGDIRFIAQQDARARPIFVGTLNGAGQAVRLDDPVVEDKIVVVPGHFGQAILQPQKHIDFALLPTAAGVALTPFADDLSVTSSQTQVVIAREAGLVLAVAPDELPKIAEKATPTAAPHDDESFLDFASWGKIGPDGFLATERNLRDQAITPGADGPEAARLQLAKFYLANGFDAETLGLLDLLQGKNQKSEAGGMLQIMRAAADYMMGRYKDAHNDLIGPSFDDDRHAALWRGLIDTKLGNYALAYSHLLQAADVVGHYRPDIQAKMRLAAAKSALALGHSEDARKQLDLLPAKMPADLKPAAGLIRARLYAAWGDKRMADAHFAEVETGPDPQAAAEAIYYRIDAGLKNGSISTQEAINALERLRYRWRGGQLELDTLNTLATLYDKQERWREELRTLHVLARYMSDRTVRNQAQDKMREIFTDLFLNGKADKMNPVDALGLFYDYIDLTPIGPAGDEMIRRMADRLVKVDLLGPAADLLQYQVDNRLQGTAKAQVATSLAAIQLMDSKPKEALNTLLTTRISALPDQVLHRRQLYQARALAELKRWDEALDILAVDQQPDTRQLRADIYWKSGNWKMAAQSAEELLGNVWNQKAPLNEEARQQVMRAAVAYAMAGDDAALNRIRARFTLKMENTGDAQAFAVLTQRTDMRGMAFRQAASQVASLDTLKSFVADLEKKAKE